MRKTHVRRRIILGVLFTGASAWVATSIYLGEIMLRLPRKPLSGISTWEVAPPENAEITTADGLPMRGWFFRRPSRMGAR